MLDFATVSVVEEVPGLNYILFLKKSIRQVHVHELPLNSVIMLLQRDILETHKDAMLHVSFLFVYLPFKLFFALFGKFYCGVTGHER